METPNISKHVIRTSDRNTFRQCRQLWDYSSKLRQNFEPVIGYKPFEFGTAWHTALEWYYNPRTWYLLSTPVTAQVVHQQALKSFNEVLKAQLDERRDAQGALGQEIEADFNERKELGEGMLKHYFKWAPTVDKGLTPIYAEIEFEVPILNAVGKPMECSCHAWPVVYQGRLDGIVQDPLGRYWILEHKTTGQMGRTEHLSLDPQCGSYIWAIQQMLGINCHGVIYSQALKDFPSPPKRLVSPRQGRWFSVNKQQRTTYEVYKQHLEEAGEHVPNYSEFLEYLKEQGNPFFRRIQVDRPKQAIDKIGQYIMFEAIEMLNPITPIYPNPSYFNCNGCRFREPCLAKQNGMDEKFLLENMFKQREPANV